MPMDLTALFTSWKTNAQSLYEGYAALGRPLLDVLHIIFDNAFYILLSVTFVLSVLFLLITLLTIKKPKTESVSSGYAPMVTVQIPTFNETVAIRCAQACLHFDYPKDKYHILIGDDSNKKEVSDALIAFARNHPSISIIKRESNKGYKPGNLNNMLAHSKGEFIVIFDSDFVPQPHFLKHIVQPFKDDEKIAAVQAKWSFLNPHQNLITALGAAVLTVFHYITLPFLHRYRHMSFLCGSAEAVRKSTLISLGKWDEGNMTEDIEYSIRIINSGHRTVYLETLTCDSEIPYRAKDYYRQQMRWAYGVVHSFKKHAKTILTSKNTAFLDKLCQGIILSGYLLSFLLLFLFFTGFLSIITHAPGPIEWGVFITETLRNILITSGLLISTIVALVRGKDKKLIAPTLASSFSFGLIGLYHVNKGIYKAIMGRPMEWFMLQKQGNSAYS